MKTPPDPRAVPCACPWLGPNAIPVLTRALTNDEKIVRLGSRACLDMLRDQFRNTFPKPGAGRGVCAEDCGIQPEAAASRV